MAVLATLVLDQVEDQLLDNTNRHWSVTVLMRYLNDGQRLLVVLKPDLGAAIADLTCVAGPKQTIAADGLQLLAVLRNMGTSGTTPGRVPRLVDMKVMNDIRPNWQADTPSATVKHWMTDMRQPRTFWVWPPQPATGQGHLEVQYTKLPADLNLTPGSQNIGVPDECREPLQDYMIYRALAKGFKQGNLQGATSAYQRLAAWLGLSDQAEIPGLPKPAKLKEVA